MGGGGLPEIWLVLGIPLPGLWSHLEKGMENSLEGSAHSSVFLENA